MTYTDSQRSVSYTHLDVYKRQQYSMLIDLVTYPTGSYNSYSEKFEELDTQVAELCGKLNTMIPVVY